MQTTVLLHSASGELSQDLTTETDCDGIRAVRASAGWTTDNAEVSKLPDELGVFASGTRARDMRRVKPQMSVARAPSRSAARECTTPIDARHLDRIDHEPRTASQGRKAARLAGTASRGGQQAGARPPPSG